MELELPVNEIYRNPDIEAVYQRPLIQVAYAYFLDKKLPIPTGCEHNGSVQVFDHKRVLAQLILFDRAMIRVVNRRPFKTPPFQSLIIYDTGYSRCEEPYIPYDEITVDFIHQFLEELSVRGFRIQDHDRFFSKYSSNT